MEKALRLKKDPVYFSTHILQFTPYPYQERLLRDPSKRLIAVCGRQIGKSTCAAVKLIHFAYTHPKTLSIIVSATLRQSMETYIKVQGFIDRNPWLKQCVTRATQTQVFLNNGSRIVALPSGRYGNTLRGLTVHFAVLDEAAFIPEEVITNVVFPMLMTTGGSLWMLTTPWDRTHVTHKCFTNAEWSVYHLPSHVNPLVTPGFLEEQRRLIGEERFLMEYEGQFVDDAKSYFPMTLIRLCLPEGGEEVLGLKPGTRLYAGYDPGGKESQAALAVVERSQDLIYVRYLRTARGKPYTEFTVEVKDVHKATPFQRLCIDQTGLGEPIVEHARELGLPVDGLKLTAPVKEQLFSNLKLLMEQRRIVIPDEPAQINALNCVEYERMRGGGYTFTHRVGTYDDLAYALALACWGATREKPSPEVEWVIKAICS